MVVLSFEMVVLCCLAMYISPFGIIWLATDVFGSVFFCFACSGKENTNKYDKPGVYKIKCGNYQKRYFGQRMKIKRRIQWTHQILQTDQRRFELRAILELRKLQTRNNRKLSSNITHIAKMQETRRNRKSGNFLLKNLKPRNNNKCAKKLPITYNVHTIPEQQTHE